MIKGDAPAVDRTGKLRAAQLKRLNGAPADALYEWMTRSKIESGPVFRGIREGRVLSDSLSPKEIAGIIETAAERAGIEGQWGEVSLRKGYVEDAVLRGVSRARIGSDTGAQSPNQVREAIRRLAATTVDTAAMDEGGNR